MKSTVVAICAAIVFVVIASINNVHAWPLIAPFVAGIAVMNGNKADGERQTYGSKFRSGLLAALATVVLAFLSLLLFAKEAILNAVKKAGYQLNNDSVLPLLIVAVLLGVIFLFTFLVGTALGALVSSRNKK